MLPHARSRSASQAALGSALAALLVVGLLALAVTPADARSPKAGPRPSKSTLTPTASPTATVTPAPTSTATPTSAPASARVTACGRSLCLAGAPWRLHAASVLGGLDRPADTVSLARQAHLNTLRLTDWLDTSGSPASAPYDETRWRRLDALVSAAADGGLHVVLDLSTYRNLLARNSLNPYTYDWTPFLTWVAARRNTVSGQVYGADPTIAMVSFAGEVEPPNGSDNTLGVTSSQVTAFFDRVFSTWGRLSPGTLRSTGGLLQLDWSSGVDWKAIMALPGSDVCAIHTYSDADRTVTLPAVSQYCGGLGRPWIDEEFGFELGMGDSARAAALADTYRRVAQAGGAGAGIWNLGFQQQSPTFDVNTSTPLAFDAVRAAAP